MVCHLANGSEGRVHRVDGYIAVHHITVTRPTHFLSWLEWRSGYSASGSAVLGGLVP